MFVAWFGGQAAKSAVEATTGLVSSSATAAGAVAMSTANISVAVSELTVGIARGSLSLVHETWRGIDIVNAQCSAAGLRWFHREDFAHDDILEGPMAGHVDALPVQQRGELLKALETVGPALPVIERPNASLKSASNFSYWMYQIKWFREGFTGVRFLFGHISFEARWARPAWDRLYDVTTEETQLLDRLFSTLLKTVNAPWLFRDLEMSEISQGAVPAERGIAALPRLAKHWSRQLAALLR